MASHIFLGILVSLEFLLTMYHGEVLEISVEMDSEKGLELSYYHLSMEEILVEEPPDEFENFVKMIQMLALVWSLQLHKLRW